MPRQEERKPYLEEVELNFASGKRLARVSDISMGGCYVDSIAAIPVGETLTLGIARNGVGIMELSGKVAYVLEGFGFGVQFIALTENQTKFLKEITDAHGG